MDDPSTKLVLYELRMVRYAIEIPAKWEFIPPKLSLLQYNAMQLDHEDVEQCPAPFSQMVPMAASVRYYFPSGTVKSCKRATRNNAASDIDPSDLLRMYWSASAQPMTEEEDLMQALAEAEDDDIPDDGGIEIDSDEEYCGRTLLFTGAIFSNLDESNKILCDEEAEDNEEVEEAEVDAEEVEFVAADAVGKGLALINQCLHTTQILAMHKATRGRVRVFLVDILLKDAWGCWGQRVSEFHRVHPDGSPDSGHPWASVLLRDMWGCWEQRIPEFHRVHPDGSPNSGHPWASAVFPGVGPVEGCVGMPGTRDPGISIGCILTAVPIQIQGGSGRNGAEEQTNPGGDRNSQGICSMLGNENIKKEREIQCIISQIIEHNKWQREPGLCGVLTGILAREGAEDKDKDSAPPADPNKRKQSAISVVFLAASRVRAFVPAGRARACRYPATCCRWRVAVCGTSPPAPKKRMRAVLAPVPMDDDADGDSGYLDNGNYNDGDRLSPGRRRRTPQEGGAWGALRLPVGREVRTERAASTCGGVLTRRGCGVIRGKDGAAGARRDKYGCGQSKILSACDMANAKRRGT
ncbi:hypothetical protein B0H14DRAFT_2567586 [Mycena olivaceomarginata]|nr:hypothetical protein B0H14DRAFT_2567586 [Mycena olivaceomarginata]